MLCSLISNFRWAPNKDSSQKLQIWGWTIKVFQTVLMGQARTNQVTTRLHLWTFWRTVEVTLAEWATTTPNKIWITTTKTTTEASMAKSVTQSPSPPLAQASSTSMDILLEKTHQTRWMIPTLCTSSSSSGRLSHPWTMPQMIRWTETIQLWHRQYLQHLNS